MACQLFVHINGLKTFYKTMRVANLVGVLVPHPRPKSALKHTEVKLHQAPTKRVHLNT